MPSVEERLAYLEGRVEDQGRSVSSLGDGMTRLEGRIDGLDLKVDRYREELTGRIDTLTDSVGARFDAMDTKIDRCREDLSGRIDALTESVNSRFDSVNYRFDSVNSRFDAVDRRFDAVDGKLSRHLVWVVGIQVSVMLAVIAALLGG